MNLKNILYHINKGLTSIPEYRLDAEVLKVENNKLHIIIYIRDTRFPEEDNIKMRRDIILDLESNNNN